MPKVHLSSQPASQPSQPTSRCTFQRGFRRATSMVALVLLLQGAVAGPSLARSGFVLAYPPALGSIPAGAYDDDGNRIGEASLRYERRPNGRIHLKAKTAHEGGARNVIEAEFEEIGSPPGLRVLWERSLSHGEDGKPMVLVEVDHEKREARCTPPGKDAKTEILALPENDRVANTTMSLLFLPIVRGDETRIEYNTFMCRGGARFMNFVAVPGPAREGDDGSHIFEVRFAPDFGTVLSWFASVVVPKLRFWFDPTSSGDYVAHRMPLYGGGPEVIVIRDGVAIADLTP